MNPLIVAYRRLQCMIRLAWKKPWVQQKKTDHDHLSVMIASYNLQSKEFITQNTTIVL